MTRPRSLILALALALCVPAAAGAATVKASKACYLNGDTIVMKGDGFAPDAPVTFTVNNQAIGGFVNTNGDGHFEATYPPAASETENRLVIRATDSQNTTAKTVVVVTRERSVTAVPDTTNNVRTWKAVFKLYGFGKGKVYIHYIGPNGKHQKTVKLGRLRGPCGRLKTTKRRVLPFSDPDFGTWKLQFDTRRKFSRNTAKKRVIPVRVFRG